MTCDELDRTGRLKRDGEDVRPETELRAFQAATGDRVRSGPAVAGNK
jgi:hypothetical protein